MISFRERYTDLKFHENLSTGSKDTTLFRISRWRLPPSWISCFRIFWCFCRFYFVRDILISNFMKIRPLVQKLQHFFEFQDGGRRHLGLHLSVILGAFDDFISWEVYWFEISWKSVHWFKRYNTFSYFKMAATAILDFMFSHFLVFLPILLCERYSDFKFYENPSTGSKVTALLWKLDFGWDFSIWGIFGWFLGDNTPWSSSVIVLSYKRHFLTPNHVFWAIERQNRSRRLGCAGEQE